MAYEKHSFEKGQKLYAKDFDEMDNQVAENDSLINNLKLNLSNDISDRIHGDSLKADSKDLERTKKSLSMLWKLKSGIDYTFDDDTDSAYRKSIPSGAKMLDVNSIGGKSIVWNNQANTISSSNWAGADGYTLYDGYFTGTSTANYGGMYCKTDANIASGNIVYVSMYAKGKATIAVTQRSSYTQLLCQAIDTSEYTKITNVRATPKAVDSGIRVQDNNTSDWAEWSVKDVHVFDMTRMFGVTTAAEVTNEMKDICDSYASAHPEFNSGEIISADVSSVNISSSDGTTSQTITVPDSIRALPGYGWSAGTAYNEVDYENQKYIQRVQRVDMGTLEWSSGWSAYATGSVIIPTTGDAKNHITSQVYNVIDVHNSKYDKSISIIYSTPTYAFNGKLWINDTSYSTAAELKAALSGKYLYYELSTPIETDISDLLSYETENLECEGGGSITMVQSDAEKHLYVPSAEEYVVKVSEAN